MASKLFEVMILLDGSIIYFIERGDPFKNRSFETAKEIIFGLNRYNGL
jgi:hypothetical protein